MDSFKNNVKLLWLSKSQEPIDVSRFKRNSSIVTWTLALSLGLLVIILSYKFSLDKDVVVVRDDFDTKEIPISLYSRRSIIVKLKQELGVEFDELEIVNSNFPFISLDEFFSKFEFKTGEIYDCRKDINSCIEGDFHFATKFTYDDKTYISFSHSAGLLKNYPIQLDMSIIFSKIVCQIYVESFSCDPDDPNICKRVCSDVALNLPDKELWNISKIVEIGRPGQVVFKEIDRNGLSVVSFGLSSFLTSIGLISLIVKLFLISNKTTENSVPSTTNSHMELQA
jgi:hypothetical protein